MEVWTLRRTRRSRGLTQEDCAAVLKISRSYYAQLESKTRRMNIEQAKKLSELLNISLDNLFDALNDADSVNGAVVKTGTEN